MQSLVCVHLLEKERTRERKKKEHRKNNVWEMTKVFYRERGNYIHLCKRYKLSQWEGSYHRGRKTATQGKTGREITQAGRGTVGGGMEWEHTHGPGG